MNAFLRSYRAEILIALAGILFAAIWFPIRMHFPFDDTYITFRYALHLVHGYGVVWNPGGPPTEGYTNFFFMILLVPFCRLGCDLIVVSQSIGVIAVILSAIAIYRIVTEANISSSAWPAPVAVVLFFFDPYSWMNAFSGMETSLFTMWLLLAIGAFARHRTLAFALAALAALTRPEGALMGFLLLFVSIAPHRGTTRTPYPIRQWILAFLLPLTVYAAWKRWYFGDLLPNSFYVKVAQLGSGSSLPGLGTIVKFYERVWYVLPLAAIAVWKDLQNRSVMVSVLWCVLLSMFYCCSQLLMPEYGRFTNSIEGIAIILAAVGLSRIRLFTQHPRSLSVALVSFHLFWMYIVCHALVQMEDPHTYEQTYRHIASVLRSIPHHEEIAVAWSDAGILPYGSEMRHIDMVGLNTTAIARAHSTQEVVQIIAQSRPDLIIIPLSSDTQHGMNGQIFQGGHGLIGKGFGMLLARPELASYKPIATLPVVTYDLEFFADTLSVHYPNIYHTLVPRIGHDPDFLPPVMKMK